MSELKVHIELTRFVQPEKIEIDANERAVNEKSQYCFFVCTTFDSFLNDFKFLKLSIGKNYGQLLFCVPSMALILLVQVQPWVFTAKRSEPQVGIGNGMDGGSGVAKFLSLRTET
ncbi:hypothetical protein [Roseburia intestinalis]|uniref:hypothetical protein n=1 Tax=Roseburia intestinalis TaxID=166486 RepID=UPI00352001FE